MDLVDINGFDALMYARIAGNDDIVKRWDEHLAKLKADEEKKRLRLLKIEKRRKKAALAAAAPASSPPKSKSPGKAPAKSNKAKNPAKGGRF